MPKCDCPAHGLAASRNLLMSEDVDELHRLADALPSYYGTGPRVLDIGAGSGTSALAILHSRADAEVFTLDTNIHALHSTEQAVRNVGARHRWTPVYLLDTQPDWPFWLRRIGFDLVLVDGDHSMEGVCSDIRYIEALEPLPLTVWFHDYAAPPPEWGDNDDWKSYGVYVAVEVLAETTPDWQIVRTAGLGATLERHPQPSPEPKPKRTAKLPPPSGKSISEGVRL